MNVLLGVIMRRLVIGAVVSPLKSSALFALVEKYFACYIVLYLSGKLTSGFCCRSMFDRQGLY